MKARDTERLRAARNLLAALTNELVAKGKKPNDILPDADAYAVVKRLAKQRKDSIAQFKAGGREDLVLGEETELAYLSALLPAEMSEDDIRALVIKKKEELGISDKSKIGVLIGAVMKEAKGNADGNVIKKIAEGLFE
ncbi:MAG: GatB/YqeY domain-containing protein [Parcubacteria group bacterium]|nr:GatB/YqeY domain-containing protein [Parcubacteria group bacterium]